MAFLDETGLAHFWNQILARLNKFVPAEAGKGLSSNDYTTKEKEKLAGIEAGANKTIVDSTLSNTSTNPVQNKIINTKLTTMQSDIDSKADADHAHSELVNGNASIVLNMNTGGTTYDLSPQYITTYFPESTNVYSYLGTSSNKWDHVYARNINLNGTDLQSTLDSKVPSTRTVNGKALIANITLSASDVGALPNTTQIPSIDGLATETYVDNKVAGLVDSAPATLDTLNELAAALGDDPNFATTVATQIGTKVDKVDGKGLSTNDYTNAEKTKLSGIAEGAEVNQNAFSNVVVGSTTISADSKTDTLTLVAGNNVTITPDATNDKVTISAIDTVYTHPSYTAKSSGLYKITVDATGHVSATTAVGKSDITGLGIPAQDTTYSTGNSTTAGITKLYTGTGTATDGTMTQSAITSAIDELANDSDVFIAEYGVTTSAEIHAAILAEKAVFCKKDNSYYPLYTEANATTHTFVSAAECLIVLRCSSDVWQQDFIRYAPTDHASSHASDGYDPITPADIGALATAGGTMTGNLTIDSTASINLERDGATDLQISDGVFFINGSGGAKIIEESSSVTTPALGFYGLNANETVALKNASVVTMRTATLLSANWDTSALTQSVAVSGVLADETKQLIDVYPVSASEGVITSANVRCTAQAANSLTFTCGTVPSEDISFNIYIQNISTT